VTRSTRKFIPYQQPPWIRHWTTKNVVKLRHVDGIVCYNLKITVVVITNTLQWLQSQQQAVAVLTATGHIASATYQVRLRISTARWTFPILHYGMGDFPQKISLPWANTNKCFLGLRPFLGLTGWAGTRKVKPTWILQKQETVSGISWAACKSAPRSRQMTMPAPHHSVFYRSDALPAAQPTASKHWRHTWVQSQMTPRFVQLF